MGAVICQGQAHSNQHPTSNCITGWSFFLVELFVDYANAEAANEHFQGFPLPLSVTLQHHCSLTSHSPIFISLQPLLWSKLFVEFLIAEGFHVFCDFKDDPHRANTEKQLLSSSRLHGIGWAHLIMKDCAIYKSFGKLTISRRVSATAALHCISLFHVSN